MRPILILAYYSIKDPLMQSAVLPYFIDLPDKHKFTFILLSYEHKQYDLSLEEVARIKQHLAANNIIWHQLKWHSGSLKVLKKLYDFLNSIFTIFSMAKKYKIKAIYSEGFPGAILGYYACRILRLEHYIHTFEPHANYMLEAGVWNKNQWEYKLLKWHEKRVAQQARFVFTATMAFKERIASWGVDHEKLFRVPSCIDLDRFDFDPQSRSEIRSKFGFSDTDKVIVYLGKLGGMYMEEELFDLYRVLAISTEVVYKFLFITPENTAYINSAMLNRGVSKDRVKVLQAPPSEVPGYLSAADVGFVAVKPKPSKRYCSPIKTGEYLACGLPVIVPMGVSDDFEILEKKGIGLILKSDAENPYKELTDKLSQYFQISDPQEIRKVARGYCAEDRDIQIYKGLYSRLFGQD